MKLTEEELEKINKRQSTLRKVAGAMLIKIENGITEEYYDGEPISILNSYIRLEEEIKDLETKKLNHYKALQENS